MIFNSDTSFVTLHANVAIYKSEFIATLFDAVLQLQMTS